ncbi:type II toxin-antitoxin system RelE/ParE family toxin [Butyrivibrio sp. INlla21]|uniref:type II toxin-antitoxin system RelE/ParE family toxin n=1 Tax=Butyrivibrio sp. INlla21 TaxID=1520811 RepID=UPI0008E10347|nr:type II toxin-antitoxin system RelE/ParE family toxin [Butyrivibrio sp. INlla21]SFU52306.1 Plasmid stabilization system protein ParE [Butyrivibrio sp. INlla21]
MNEIIFSPLVKKKMKALKEWLSGQFDEETAKSVLSGMISDTDILIENEKCGTNIAEMYEIDTDYWYLFTHQHYLIYRVQNKKVVIVQMFHEREDFMMKLFGISGRTQESIDYWGE